MNPSVGTFISMDSYSGSIDDPVSLHKYLYANANPVSNSDPSGYSSLADLNTSMGMQGILNDIGTINAKGMLDMVKGMFGFANDIISTIKDGKEQGLTKEKIIENVAAGLVTSLVTNFSCMLTSLGPVGYALMGLAALVVGMVAVANFANGNTGMGIAQVINLVTIVFSMFNPTCFTGDTPVYTDDGLVCIEDIQVGDEVWAYNPETGETELKEVLNVWVKETNELLHLETSDGETIDTTTNHPFYVDEKGWVAAGDLEIGDTLVTADGDKVEVSDIEIEKLAEPILVYNLEVDDFHTYFVGEYGVLVHNSLCGSNSAKLGSNMAKEGRAVGPGEAAAHIVASTGKEKQWKWAEKSREILSFFGIDINTAANGVPLGQPRPHNLTHNTEFNKRVYEILSNVVSEMSTSGYGHNATRTKLLNTLRDIGKQIMSGDFNI